MSTWSYTFNTAPFKGTVEVPTGLFINGKFVEGGTKKTIESVCTSSRISCNSKPLAASSTPLRES